MAIIYSYPQETNPQAADLILGTSTVTENGKQTNVTRSYTIQTLTDYIKSLGGIGVESITFDAPLTGGTITKTGTVTIPQSGATSDGYLSQADWNTFNNKLGGISGTQYKIPIWSTTAALGNSSLTETGGGTTVTSSKSFVADGTVDLGLTGTRWNAIYGTTTDTTALVVSTSLNANGSEGTAGQLLTSGGPGAAMSWVNASTIGDIYTLKAETKSGSYVPVTLDAATGTDSTVRFTEGTGITLTEGGASPTTTLTIEANTAAVANGATTTLATGDQIYDFTVALPLNSFAAATGDIDAGTQKIINLGTPVTGTDAATKTYVDSSISSTATFQGGYDAATNTPDLDTSPATDIKNGWFWIVTVAGDFFAEAVQPGDMIYANQDNPGAVYANWTVIHTGGPAGSGATDGATAKGTAGFDSADFDVTANGWVQAKNFSGTTPGYVPDASAVTGDKFLKRDGTWAAGPVSSVYEVLTGNGLTGGPITGTGTISPDYTTANNIILSAADGTSDTLADADDIIFSVGNTVKYGNLSQVKAYIGNNPGTGTLNALAYWDTTSTLGSSMLSQNAGATLLTNNGSFTTTTITDSGGSTGTAGQVLTAGAGGGAVTWGAAAASYTKWIVSDGSSSSDVNDGDTVTFTTGTSGTSTNANDAISITESSKTVTVVSNAFDGEGKVGHVPDATGNTSNFLRGDGQWAAAGGGSLVKDEFTATASQTAFTVSQAPLDINYVNVFVSGVYQNKSAIASVSGTIVTLQTGVPVGTKVEMVTSY